MDAALFVFRWRQHVVGWGVAAQGHRKRMPEGAKNIYGTGGLEKARRRRQATGPRALARRRTGVRRRRALVPGRFLPPRSYSRGTLHV